jgi:transposase
VVVWLGLAQPARAVPYLGQDRPPALGGHPFAYFDSGLTSAAIEAINGIIQLAKRIARGFKNFIYFRTAAYLRAGCLRFELPVIN